MKDKGLPLQSGTDDCGVMTLMYAKFLLCDEDVFKVYQALTGNLAVLQKCTQVWKGGYRKIMTEEIKSKIFTLQESKIGDLVKYC